MTIEITNPWPLLISGKLGRNHCFNDEALADFRQRADQVPVTRAELCTHVASIDRWERMTRFTFSRHEHVREVWYEDLEERPAELLAELYDWLEVPDGEYRPDRIHSRKLTA